MARLRRALGLLVCCAGLAACTSQPSGGPTTTTSRGGATPTTSIVPVTIPGTVGPGSLSVLGLVSRLPVEPVPAGRAGAVLPRPGTPAYRAVVQVAYRQLGSGPPLLLVSGEDASMSWWAPTLLETLAQHYQVTVFDLPGVGYSGPAPLRLSIAWLGDVSAGLASELGLSSPVVVGWGMGAQIALAMAERHPSLVGDLVLDDTGLAVPGSRRTPAGVARLFAAATVTPSELSRVMFPPSAALARGAWLRALMAQVPDDVTAGAITAEAQLEQDTWRSGGSLVDGLRALRLPVLVMGGATDGVFPSVDTTALSAAIPGSQHRLIAGSGYAALDEQPAEVSAVLQDFTG